MGQSLMYSHELFAIMLTAQFGSVLKQSAIFKIVEKLYGKVFLSVDQSV